MRRALGERAHLIEERASDLVGAAVASGRGGSIRSDGFPSMRRARLLLAFAPALVDMARDQNRRERAVVWLEAFEDELTRRHRLSGRAARRWQREH